MRIKEKYSNLSNLLFLIPAYFAFMAGMDNFAYFILCLFFASIFFHITKPSGYVWWNDTSKLNTLQKFGLWVDSFFAIFLFAYILYIFWQKGWGTEFYITITIAVLALYIFFFRIKRNEYDFYHGVWHTLSAIITILAVIA